MQDCLVDANRCGVALEGARGDLALCRAFLGEDPTAEGVLGAVATAFAVVEVARVWWRRCHGPDGPAFPLDR
jgi:hypothetical protein